MAAYATVPDYEARAAVSLPEGSPQRAQVEAYLDDASALIKRHIPTGYEPDEAMLRALCVTVVRRVIANPGGRRQRTIGIYSETLGENGGLYLTDEEIEQLQPETATDPDADAAYSVSLDLGTAGWVPDPVGRWPL
ncbi:hypothetical protein [Streptomyces sp. B15]|uniref:hypothetical protein n=1 Tax=Streptomyces sp. B15 TaxID=1537797 RepID=UPI001B36C177|nr:hypothetical protein [Streptomyces sp. B15]MBQ1122643.1 hypothetical protein [Streptomyces sp. B15]